MKRSPRMLRLAAFLSLPLLGAFAAQAQVDILFVGNSFTHGHNDPVMSYNHSAITDANGTNYGGVPGIFKKLTDQAGLSYNVTIEAVSSQTLAGHYSTEASVIGQSLWDVVVLQENSTYPLPTAHGGHPSTFLSGADNIQNLVLSKNPDADLYLYETWASPTSVDDQGYSAGTTGLHEMQNDLTSAYYKAFYDYGFTGVARVGDSFLRAVDQGIADSDPRNGVTAGTINLWNTDYRHASKYGSYLSAAVLFAKITQYNPTLLSYSGSAAFDLGISETDFSRLNELAFEINALADPAPGTTPPPPAATLNTLKGGTNLNWNAAANWDHALAATDAVLINSSSAAISQVANGLDGSGHAASIQTLSFDIGATSKTIQPNLTTQNPRTMTLTGGTDALGGTDLIHLSATTTGVAGIGLNSGFSTLTVMLATSGSFNIENAAGTLRFGGSSIVAGNVNLTKTGRGRLVFEGLNTFGGTGKVFTISAGTVLANTPTSGLNSATGASGVEVSSNAILGGIGQITPGAGNQIIVRAGGILAPGADGIGTLTINGSNTALNVLTLDLGAKFTFELNSAGAGSFLSDRISLVNDAATGGIEFHNNVIDFVDLSSGTLAPGAYILFSANRADNFTNLTTDGSGNITAGLSIGSGLNAYGNTFLQQVGNNIVLNVASVPEPAPIGLMTIGLLALTIWRKRRFAAGRVERL